MQQNIFDTTSLIQNPRPENGSITRRIVGHPANGVKRIAAPPCAIVYNSMA
jgi:hypothetical protein